ncbi:hypothetical protein EBS57_04725 [bacterium]|nr:hypothetical protein [bacterium]
MANVARIGNLVLTMDRGEPVEVRVGDIVARITITEVRFGKVRISFRAPRTVAIVRANAKRKIEREFNHGNYDGNAGKGSRCEASVLGKPDGIGIE